MKLRGGPLIVRTPGQVEVRQRQGPGWVLLAFGFGLPAAVLLGAGPARPPGSALGWLALGLAVLFFAAIGLWGLFWLLWRRRLTVWPQDRRWRFDTGLPGCVTRHEGDTAAPVTIELAEQRYSGRHGSGGEAGAELAGTDYRAFRLALALPGSREPLHLGEWTDAAEARLEAQRWQELFPAAVLRVAPVA